jgi:hypothetical protein
VLFGIWTSIYLAVSAAGIVLGAGSLLRFFFIVDPDVLDPAALHGRGARLWLLTSVAWFYLTCAIRQGAGHAWYFMQLAWVVSFILMQSEPSFPKVQPGVLMLTAVLSVACWVNLYTDGVRAFCGIQWIE